MESEIVSDLYDLTISTRIRQGSDKGASLVFAALSGMPGMGSSEYVYTVDLMSIEGSLQVISGEFLLPLPVPCTVETQDR